jgi:hypothetical protein
VQFVAIAAFAVMFIAFVVVPKRLLDREDED